MVVLLVICLLCVPPPSVPNRIMERASREIELEKSKMKDEVKQEMVAVATVMAGKFVASSLDSEKQAQLIDEALNEMGDDTWQN